MRNSSTVAIRALVAFAGPITLLTLSFAACRAPEPPVDNTAMSAQEEAPAIRLALHDFIDRTPGVKPIDLEVAQVGVDSGYALVTWMHEEAAGQAVLRKQNGAWTVVDCEAGWMGLRGVCAEKVPEAVAQRLLDQVDPRWGSYETP